MPLRRRPAAPQPGPADRVRLLLSGSGGGWVPPPEPDDEEVTQPLRLGRLPGGADADRPAAAVELPAVGGADAAAWEDGRAVPDLAPRDRAGPEDVPWSERPGPGPDASWQPVTAEADAGSGWLPPALNRGRIDPGRRGAVALVVAALLAAVVAGGVVLRGRPQEVAAPRVVASGVPLPGASAAAPTPSAVPTGEVVVAVAGEVVRPGLVRLPAGSRVDDAVRAAGGVLPGAGPGLLNLARVLVDGEQVLVGVDPPPGAVPGAAAPGPPGAADGPVDLNTAGVAELDALPGIGPVLAQRIVDWRTEHGRFASVEQLREVTGIGEAKYADLEPEVTVP